MPLVHRLIHSGKCNNLMKRLARITMCPALLFVAGWANQEPIKIKRAKPASSVWQWQVKPEVYAGGARAFWRWETLQPKVERCPLRIVPEVLQSGVVGVCVGGGDPIWLIFSRHPKSTSHFWRPSHFSDKPNWSVAGAANPGGFVPILQDPRARPAKEGPTSERHNS